MGPSGGKAGRGHERGGNGWRRAARWAGVIAAGLRGRRGARYGRLMQRLLTALIAAGAPGATLSATLDRVTDLQPRPDGLDIRAGGAALRVTAVSDGIVRIQAGPGAAIPRGEPWAVVPAWRDRTVKVQPDADGFRTGALRVRVDRAPLSVVVTDVSGRELLRTLPDRPPGFREGRPAVSLAAPPDAQYFGLGDKTGPLDRRGRSFTLWTTDAYAYNDATDPLYKSIPFYLGLAGGTAWGVFLDSTWRSFFDFGQTEPDAVRIGAAGGDLDLYLIAGPAPAAVLDRYTALTGRPDLPPLWALGYQQSRWGYETTQRVEEVVAMHRAARLPLDVIWLDIGFQDRNRPFTTSATGFPDLPGLVRRLEQEDGVRTVVITDPHIALAPGQGYLPYDAGTQADHFLRRADGQPYSGKVWPGASVFPDFTRAETRDWWGGLYRGFVADGIAGFWNDMNEPSVFDGPAHTMPQDVQHRVEEPGFPPRVATHLEIHNVWGMLNARATADGLRALAPDRRPFVLTRATFAGGQRDAFVWTGDNTANWEHLRLSVPQLLSLGMSGFAFAGADVGGFRGGPSAALLTRWIQVAAFTPFFRNHTEQHTPDQEAYVGPPDDVARRREAIVTRYRLMPYLYTVAEEAARTGMPMLRPLFLMWPDMGWRDLDNGFLLGADLLVVPPPDERLDDFGVRVPPGTGWYDFWSGARLPEQPEFGFTPSPDRVPVLVRAGAIIPMQQPVDSTARTPGGPLTLAVYPGPDCAGTLYADDGLSTAYRDGAFLRARWSCAAERGGLTLRLAPHEGAWQPWWSRLEVAVHGQGAAPRRVTFNGAAVDGVIWNEPGGTVRFTIPDAPEGGVVRITN